MKKLLLLIAFTFAAIFAQAQDYSCDSLIWQVFAPENNPYIYFNKPFSTKAHDGKVMTCLPLRTRLGYNIIDFGDLIYKTDPQNATIIDSAFYETNTDYVENYRNVLFAQHPNGNGYIIAKLAQGKDNQIWLRISLADDLRDLHENREDIMVLLDAAAYYQPIDIILESNHIVLCYDTYEHTPKVVRVGLDGTICEEVAYENLFQLDGVSHGFTVFNDMPREYAILDWTACENDTCLVYHVIDSLFTLKETFVMDSHFDDIYPVQPGSTNNGSFKPIDVLPLDDGSFVEAIQFERHNITKNGACLLKYDKATLECLANVQFESFPVYTDPSRIGYPIGMELSLDGNIYFAYRTNNNVIGGSATTKGWIGIVKLDKDLNILWQRYCLGSWTTTGGYKHDFCSVSLTEDGFLVGGIIYGTHDRLFLLYVHDDNINSVTDTEFTIRPYAYYPNPAQDRLRLQYSPDVQPKQIELYDLQGRLVRLQSQGLESLDMQGLASGQYLMKVTLEDGKSFTDKVVKE